ncbi:MAG: glycosyltransferase family 4 protein [Bacteroidota bacterium]
MKVLILTQYFPPETGAPQNRLFELALHLKQRCDRVDVLTAFPHYLRNGLDPTHKGKWFLKDSLQGLTVYRSYVYAPTRQTIGARLLNYFSFCFSSLYNGLFKLGQYDWIICESPPLFLGVTAVLLKKGKRAKLNFNVSDLWPESAEKLGIIRNRFILKLAGGIEEWIYRCSDSISGQTQGIVANIAARFPNKKIFWLRNGIDIDTFKSFLTQRDWRKEAGFTPDDIIVYYGGLMGHAQGLNTILLAAQQCRELSRLKFILVGEGPEKESLVRTSVELELKNVEFLNGIPRNQLADVIGAIDIVIVPLKKLDLFLGAIPSKIFEALAMNKPVILGVDGEAKELFVNQGKCAVFYTPESEYELATQIKLLSADKSLRSRLGENGYTYVKTYFDREKISEDFLHFLVNNNGRH